MKKFFIILIAVMLLSFSAVFAQETETELPELSFSTVGHIFGWGAKAEDVYAFLSRYGADLEIDEENACITMSSDSEEEDFSYDFYFDEETDELYMIQCFTSLSEGIDPVQIVDNLIKSYGLSDAKPYEDKTLQDFIAGFDAGMAVAGDGTIAALAASEETDETYAAVALLFADRVYYEAE